VSRNKDLIALINLIYEAALDGDLWPGVLMAIAQAVGAVQIALTSMDRRTNAVATIAPRFDPDLLALWQDYWAVPALAQAALHSAGKIYTLDDLMPREEFVTTQFFKEFWQPAQLGLSAAGANLLIEDQFSTLVCFSDAPGKESLTAQQIHIFEVALQHVTRALRISRRLWELECERAASATQVDTLRRGVLLADASGRVVRANDTARAMLDDGDGIFLDNGRLATAGSESLQKLIASCARNFHGPSGKCKISREAPRSPLDVTVTPFRSKTRLANLPWIGVDAPVAIVAVGDPDVDSRRQEISLRRRFGLTAAEARLATEILKGDGLAAAARRRGISGTTANSQVARIFEKTGTHRQTELIRLLLDAANEDKIET
jgi:DNA-binding CsgD family transcriptional regulator